MRKAALLAIPLALCQASVVQSQVSNNIQTSPPVIDVIKPDNVGDQVGFASTNNAAEDPNKALIASLQTARLFKSEDRTPKLRPHAKRGMFYYGPYHMVGRGVRFPSSSSCLA
jgi:hypothetical protein